VYFVTICTYRRDWHFGHIFNGQMSLSDIGQITSSCLKALPEHFANCSIDSHVIMPNHVHALICLTDKNKQPLGHLLNTYKGAVTRIVNRQMGIKAPRIWQSLYHDHIVRSEHELNIFRAYILENPRRWEQDSFYRS
jgi:REP element-mobilizing transposase RayT